MTGRRSNLPPRINGKFAKANNGLPNKTKDSKAYYSAKWQLIKADPLKYEEHCLRTKMQTRKRGILRCRRFTAIYKRELLEMQSKIELLRGKIYIKEMETRFANAQTINLPVQTNLVPRQSL